MKPIQFSAQIDSVNSKKDRTLSVRLGTQEMPAQDAAKILELQGLQIWVAMAELSIDYQDLDIPENVPEFRGQKSYSQRLREVMYRYWEQNKQAEEPSFNRYYEDWMEKTIGLFKEKLN